MATKTSKETAPPFDCPSWAGKPPPGLHLDVMKGDKLMEKLIIDEKKYYLFGRNPDFCDFTIDHQSCSRVHAALIYHKHLKRVFLIDLNSTHGTFLGHIRLEAHKPQQVPIDSTISFGASTRTYTIREKPQTQGPAGPGDSKVGDDEELKGLLGLPEEETELENLTEFNTAHNKRISLLTIEEGNLEIQRPKRKRRNSRVTFNEEDSIINPEDIDPSVGRFRNMIQTAVVPIKSMQGGLPLLFPNPAPEVDLAPEAPQLPLTLNPTPVTAPYLPENHNEPRKKKYAKEAWPGKKPTPSLLI
ncbi:protein phosphatase 1, regulatory subunit 8b [Cynoglossus semilaevis]|uniref:protein phosphatase 1, regulatory subunit 8b n=1 Tax=Cynoglossus semilaevis TaxID=244447 RepID=UPI000D623463|nr:nuclear inhibitor of protein phosphatase 1 [Cynoglossus semilaevis]